MLFQQFGDKVAEEGSLLVRAGGETNEISREGWISGLAKGGEDAALALPGYAGNEQIAACGTKLLDMRLNRG